MCDATFVLSTTIFEGPHTTYSQSNILELVMLFVILMIFSSWGPCGSLLKPISGPGFLVENHWINKWRILACHQREVWCFIRRSLWHLNKNYKVKKKKNKNMYRWIWNKVPFTSKMITIKIAITILMSTPTQDDVLFIISRHYSLPL